MTVPFQRLAWLTALIHAPAAVLGWLTALSGGQAPQQAFVTCYVLATILALVIPPLSWSDHIQNRLGQGCLGCLGMMLFLTTALVAAANLEFRWLEAPLAGTLYFLVLTLGIALANPEGLTLILIIVIAFVAGGLAEGFAESHRLAIGVAVPAATAAFGVLVGLVRGVMTRRSQRP